MGGRIVGPGLARMIVETWLNTAFVGAHHAKRLEKIAEYEQNHA